MLRSAVSEEPAEYPLFRLRFGRVVPGHGERTLCDVTEDPIRLVETLGSLMVEAARWSPAAAAAANRWITDQARPAPAPPAEGG
jgi:hypothetical protein